MMPDTEHRSPVSEITSTLLPLITILAVSLLAFNREQRIQIREERDEGKCQHPACLTKPICGAESRECATCPLHVHHILGQRYLKNFDVDPDFPENAITIGKPAHDAIHPDVKTAQRNYHTNKNSYHEIFDARNTLLDQRKIYWVSTWDRAMQVIAIKRTQLAKKRGWVFPEREEK